MSDRGRHRYARLVVQLSWDACWETDANHRLNRHELSEELPDSLVSGTEIGKTPRQIPYVEPTTEHFDSWKRAGAESSRLCELWEGNEDWARAVRKLRARR